MIVNFDYKKETKEDFVNKLNGSKVVFVCKDDLERNKEFFSNLGDIKIRNFSVLRNGEIENSIGYRKPYIAGLRMA
jgi:hypothetical protein